MIPSEGGKRKSKRVQRPWQDLLTDQVRRVGREKVLVMNLHWRTSHRGVGHLVLNSVVIKNKDSAARLPRCKFNSIAYCVILGK